MTEKVLSNRQIALKNGDKFYHGKPCKNCGDTEKYTISHACVLCQRSKAITRERTLYTQEGRREKMLRDNYGITTQQYEFILSQQNHRCKICNIHVDESPQKVKFAVDHCHKTKINKSKSEAIRGIICRNCNVGIGMFNDDISLFAKAIEYLYTFQNKGEINE